MERIAGVADVADGVELEAAADDWQGFVDDIEPMRVVTGDAAGQCDHEIRVFDD